MKAIHWSLHEEVWHRMEVTFLEVCRYIGSDGAFFMPVVRWFGADLNIDSFITREIVKWTRYGAPR